MWQSKPFRSFHALIMLIWVSNSILINQTIDDGLGDLRTGLEPSGSIVTVNCEFLVDGQVVGHYTQTPASDVFKYNTLHNQYNQLDQHNRRTISSDAPTISAILPRDFRRGHVSPFILAGAPAILSIPPSKLRSEHTDPFTSHEEAELEYRTFDPPQAMVMPHGQGDLLTQGLVACILATLLGLQREDVTSRHTGAPVIFSVLPLKIRSKYTSPFTSQEDAGIERRISNPPREIATPGDRVALNPGFGECSSEASRKTGPNSTSGLAKIFGRIAFFEHFQVKFLAYRTTPTGLFT
ncbi:hypothetical protein BD779DRAFT_1475173 [Infundibulicybe gibba]|nr:hypothetical protein BD779DRAFT_1475173 [Infundibulicybe gibba]